MKATLLPLLGSRLSRPAAHLLVTAALAVGALCTSGCSTATSETNLMMFADNAPLPTLVERGTELAAAEHTARQQRGSFAVKGEGSSMEPFYLAGTAVVVRAGGFETLRPGLAVVYANHRGVAVAHMLVERLPHGWRAVGLNNEGSDGELVTADNLVGVITHAYAANTGSLPERVATRVALVDGIRRGSKLASLGR